MQRPAQPDARGSEGTPAVDKESYGYKAQVLMYLIKRAENQLRQFSGQWVICEGPMDPPEWAKEVSSGKGRALNGSDLAHLGQKTWPCSSSPVVNFCGNFLSKHAEEELLQPSSSEGYPLQPLCSLLRGHRDQPSPNKQGMALGKALPVS